MLTFRDKQIIKHIEQYGFITNRQAREIFMSPNSVKAYEVARRRIKEIQDTNIRFGPKNKPLLVTKNNITSENVFYYDKVPTYHEIQIMNVYARLVFVGVDVELYKKHAEWLGGKYISDAFFICSHANIKYICCLEVCSTSNDSHIPGYQELYNTNELQMKFNGAFPRIILVGHQGRLPKTHLTVKEVDEDLSDIFFIFQ
ncbi:hypothetical protein [Clostridium tertium]|uniref:hypothetical protein n=1 Tax=Clostridium tertium TaxID=1559 RepID=UPI0023B2CCF8|nr:hypothetical protein [Clostridium tertium]